MKINGDMCLMKIDGCQSLYSASMITFCPNFFWSKSFREDQQRSGWSNLMILIGLDQFVMNVKVKINPIWPDPNLSTVLMKINGDLGSMLWSSLVWATYDEDQPSRFIWFHVICSYLQYCWRSMLLINIWVLVKNNGDLGSDLILWSWLV